MKKYIFLFLTLFSVQLLYSLEGPVHLPEGSVGSYESIFHVEGVEGGSRVLFDGQEIKDLTLEQKAQIADNQMPLEDQQRLVLKRVEDGAQIDVIKSGRGGYINLLVPHPEIIPPVIVGGREVAPNLNNPLEQAAFLARNNVDIQSLVTEMPALESQLTLLDVSAQPVANAYAERIQTLGNNIASIKDAAGNGQDLSGQQRRQLITYQAELNGLHAPEGEQQNVTRLLQEVDKLLNPDRGYESLPPEDQEGSMADGVPLEAFADDFAVAVQPAITDAFTTPVDDFVNALETANEVVMARRYKELLARSQEPLTREVPSDSQSLQQYLDRYQRTVLVDKARVRVLEKVDQLLQDYQTLGADQKSQQIKNMQQWLELLSKVADNADVTVQGLVDKVKDFAVLTNPKEFDQNAFIKDMQKLLKGGLEDVNNQLNQSSSRLADGIAAAESIPQLANTLDQYRATQTAARAALETSVLAQIRLANELLPKSTFEKIGDFFNAVISKVRSWFSKAPSAPEGPPVEAVANAVEKIETAQSLLMVTANDVTGWQYSGKPFDSAQAQAEGLQELTNRKKALDNSILALEELKNQLFEWGIDQNDPVIADLLKTQLLLQGKKNMLDANYAKAFSTDFYVSSARIKGENKAITLTQLATEANTLYDSIATGATVSVNDIIELSFMASDLQTALREVAQQAGISVDQMNTLEPLKKIEELFSKIAQYAEDHKNYYVEDYSTKIQNAQSNTSQAARVLELALINQTLPAAATVRGSVLEMPRIELRVNILEGAGYNDESQDITTTENILQAALDKYTKAQKVSKQVTAFTTEYSEQREHIFNNIQRLTSLKELETLTASYREQERLWNEETDPVKKSNYKSAMNDLFDQIQIKTDAIPLRITAINDAEEFVNGSFESLKDTTLQLIDMQVEDLNTIRASVEDGLQGAPATNGKTDLDKLINQVREQLEIYQSGLDANSSYEQGIANDRSQVQALTLSN